MIIASAGSGKTTFLAAEAVSRSEKRIACLTYTNSNVEEIRKRLSALHGVPPRHVEVLTWFTFLLRDCARPYQSFVYSGDVITGLCFCEGKSALYVPRTNVGRYFFNSQNEVYSDKVSEFVVMCDKKSNGLVIKRLKALYDGIFIDEIQDLAGYDLDVVELIIRSGIQVIMVGDPRQTTYATNQSTKNKQFRGVGVLEKAKNWKAKGLCRIETHARSHRCNQAICDYADRLWPDMEPSQSHNHECTGHDGIFIVREAMLHQYVLAFAPMILRYNRLTNSYGYPAINYGSAKGKTCDRVLILPHGPIKEYLRTGDLTHVKGSLTRFYVAVTRAKFSVAFLYDGDVPSACKLWEPNQAGNV